MTDAVVEVVLTRIRVGGVGGTKAEIKGLLLLLVGNTHQQRCNRQKGGLPKVITNQKLYVTYYTWYLKQQIMNTEK